MTKKTIPFFDEQIQDFLGENHLRTPCYIVDESLLRKNLLCLSDVAERSGAKILLAQKAFSLYPLYPLIGEYLDGTAASGLFEARLGHEEMGKENHVFSPAFTEDDFEEILRLCDHIVFNSVSQWQRFRKRAAGSSRSFGLRINPEHSTQGGHGIYDPCGEGSRLGIPAEQMLPDLMEGIEGLHFHTLCEQNADALAETLEAVERNFAPYLRKIKWLNLGGGHHITRHDYDREQLIHIVRRLRETYGVTVYLEPGEAIALDAGFLASRVVDILEHCGQIAILDTSAACHMPDVLEMPYRPQIVGAKDAGEKPYTYRLAGPTCLAGDVIGEYSFDTPLSVGNTVVFCDMAIYSMVKNNTFNGIPLPSIAVRGEDGGVRSVRKFGYSDFKGRLG